MRIAVITGGMGGLGRLDQHEMHAAGYRVVVTHSSGNTKAKEWISEHKASGREFSAYPVDVADFDSCKECVARIAKEIGPVDILVNNAGITRDTTFKKMSKGDWDSVIRTNLNSVFNMTKQVMDGMVDRGWGRVVNVSSVNGSKGAFGQTNYSAAKAGMHGFTKALALDVARKGVTVNTISPGYIGTKMVMAIPKEVLDTKALSRSALTGFDLWRLFSTMIKISYAGYRFPPDIIQQAIWLYVRFTRSFRDVEDLLAERGIVVSYETVRRWVNHFGPKIAADLRKRRPKPHTTWHLDEVYLKIDGRLVYLWRAVDAEGEVLDVLVQTRRNKRAALKLMRKLLKKYGFMPDKLPSRSRSPGRVPHSVGRSTGRSPP